MADYFDYVRQYRIASGALGEGGDVFWPRLQVRGLLVELALKTYLCSAGRIVEGHNLVELARFAETLGLQLSALDWSDHIENVNKIYFQFIDWNAKYLSRYPTPDRAMGVWVTPTHNSLDEMIGRIVDQAQKRWNQEEGRRSSAGP